MSRHQARIIYTLASSSHVTIYLLSLSQNLGDVRFSSAIQICMGSTDLYVQYTFEKYLRKITKILVETLSDF